MTEFSYHIYSRGEVLYVNLNEEEFNLRWQMLNSLVGPGTALAKGADFSFERVLSKLPAGDDSY